MASYPAELGEDLDDNPVVSLPAASAQRCQDPSPLSGSGASLQRVCVRSDVAARAVTAVLSGGLVALVSFGLAVLWDFIKHRRDQRERQIAALRGFREEMLGNYRAAENTLNLLGSELDSRQKREMKMLVNPLSHLEHGAWPITRVALPGGDQALLDPRRHRDRATGAAQRTEALERDRRRAGVRTMREIHHRQHATSNRSRRKRDSRCSIQGAT